MTFVDTSTLEIIERKPGWNGRFFQSPHMTLADYELKQGSPVHERFHPQEEVWQVIEGSLGLTVDGKIQVAGPGMAAIALPNVPHSIRALTDGKAIVGDYPTRTPS